MRSAPRWPWTLSRQELVDAVHARLVSAGFNPSADLAEHIDALPEHLAEMKLLRVRS